MLASDGGALSKRLGSLSLGELRDSGIEAMSLNSLIARLGTADPVEPVQDMATLIDGFDMARLGRAPARFDADDVTRLNARILHDMPYEAAADRLAEMGAPQGAAFWDSVKGNLTLFKDIADILHLIKGPVTPVIEADNVDYVSAALAALPQGELTLESWSEWTQSLKQSTGRKGRALFMPLRQALTGQAHGPEMQHLLPLIGYDKAVARLQGKTEG
jgi:glutamyl-tRNA synthetase